MQVNPVLFDIDPAPSLSSSMDPALEEVESWFQGQSSMETRFAAALRQSIDEVLDGQRTGRFDIVALAKTEKTYLGTKVEILIRTEFNLDIGSRMDYLVAGHEVDAKFTINTNWAIPTEALGHLCLVIMADDHRARFRVGLLRIQDWLLNPGRNGDRKRGVSADGRRTVRWLVPDGRLPENLLLNLSPVDRKAIFQASIGYRGGGNGGQLRINELMRRVQGRVIDRTTVITVASQLDSPKRIRDARLQLRGEGIVVLGHTHSAIALALGLPVPDKGSWVAARLVSRPTGDVRRYASINGRGYVIAHPDEPPEPAPAEY